MKDVVLNGKYKYVFDPDLNRYRINIDGSPSPLVPVKLFKFYSTNLINIASLNENYFWLSNPKDFNDPFDCNVNLVDHGNEFFKESEHIKKNDLENIGVTSSSTSIQNGIVIYGKRG